MQLTAAREMLEARSGDTPAVRSGRAAWSLALLAALALPETGCGLLDTWPDDGPGAVTVTICGRQYTGDAFFFVADKSLPARRSGALDRSKTELVQVLRALPTGTELGIFYFDQACFAFPASGECAVSNDALKAPLTAFVFSMNAGPGGDPKPALEKALRMAGKARGRKKVTILMAGGGLGQGSDAEDTLDEALSAASSLNQSHVHIHTIALDGAGEIGEAFLEKLANRHAGTFARVQK